MLWRLYAQLPAVLEISQKRCLVRASIRRRGPVGPWWVLVWVDVQYGLMTRLLGISQVRGVVRHDALSISSHLSDV